MLTLEEITQGKQEVRYTTPDDILHEHDDCIRIAYEWLDAQKKISRKIHKTYALKHLVEKWGGRYVSQSDVEVAAFLHPLVFGEYPHYNFSSKLVLPSDDRLKDIGEAFTQDYRDRMKETDYSNRE
jgi:hypothetical protein